MNYSTWLQRGWCRAEMWCKLLSDRSAVPIVAELALLRAAPANLFQLAVGNPYRGFILAMVVAGNIKLEFRGATPPTVQSRSQDYMIPMNRTGGDQL